jgi:hypothetical protein
MIDMLNQLKSEENQGQFELIAYSAKHNLRTMEAIVEAIEKNCLMSKV